MSCFSVRDSDSTHFFSFLPPFIGTASTATAVIVTVTVLPLRSAAFRYFDGNMTSRAMSLRDVALLMSDSLHPD